MKHLMVVVIIITTTIIMIMSYSRMKQQYLSGNDIMITI